MDPILIPVDDKLAQQAQAIVLLQHQLDALNSVVVYDHLERDTWLLAPGAAANTGATGSLATATQAPPTTSTAWLKLAPHGPYANAYWYEKKTPDAAKTKFQMEVSFMFGSAADAAASQAIELDIQQVISRTVFNAGLQFNFQSNQVRVWNRYAKEHGLPDPWRAVPGMVCPQWPAGQWMRVVFGAHRDSNSVHYDPVTVNGVTTAINLSFSSVNLPLPDMMNCAHQLDGNASGTAYQVYRDDVRFTVS
jgi:hypothetical protein